MNAVRRRRLRLLLRDGAAASAFGAMAISGQVPVWALGTFAVALLLALFDKRVLARRGGITGALLAAVAVALGSLVIAGGLDLVVGACAFASLISVQRLLSEPGPATDSQVHLTSLLMIAGGAALSGELLFALCLLLFAVLASISLGLGIAESALGEGEELPLRPLLRQLASALAISLALALAFFVLFPRLSWNVAARRVSPGIGAAEAGMAEKVQLSGDGSIKRNPRIVMRVDLDPDPQLATLDRYWVGHVYDTFDGESWKGSGKRRKGRNRVELLPGAPGLIHQRIELLPAYGARSLVGLWPVALFGNATAHSPENSARTLLVELEGEEVRFNDSGIGYSYHAYSLPGVEGDGAAQPTARDLQLPPNLDPRVAALAAQLAGTRRDPLQVANVLAAYLKSNYQYSLELTSDAADPLADFLFVRKAGHCEHFATALAVMLRTLGIHARIAGGFFGGERVGTQYVVRAGDAHAWTEVFAPGRGFVVVDGTPEEARAGRPSPVLDWLTRQYEALDALWRARVVDYTIVDQAALANRLVRPPRGAGSTAGGPSFPWRKIAAVLLVLIAAGLAWRRVRTRHARAPSAPATGLLRDSEQLLRAAHVQGPDEPLEELAARLREAAHPLAPAVTRVARRYVEARFGPRPMDDAEARHLTRGLARALAEQSSGRGTPASPVQPG